MTQKMNEKNKSPGMIHRLSGIAALICIVMMFIPAAEDSLAFYDYQYRGEMLIVCSRAVSGFYESEFIWKVLALFLIVVAILLLLWAIRSFKRPENIGKIGLVASVANLVVSAFMTYVIFATIHRVFIFVPVLIVLMAVIAFVLALIQKKYKNPQGRRD